MTSRGQKLVSQRSTNHTPRPKNSILRPTNHFAGQGGRLPRPTNHIPRPITNILRAINHVAGPRNRLPRPTDHISRGRPIISHPLFCTYIAKRKSENETLTCQAVRKNAVALYENSGSGNNAGGEAQVTRNFPTSNLRYPNGCHPIDHDANLRDGTIHKIKTKAETDAGRAVDIS